MSALESPSDKSAADASSAIRQVLTKELALSASLIDDADCLAAARVSEIVGTRGCRLSATAIAATVIQTGGDAKEWDSSKKLVFGLDGSLVEFYPRFEQRVRDALREILGEEVEKRVEIVLAKDGSGVGGESPCCRPSLVFTRSLMLTALTFALATLHSRALRTSRSGHGAKGCRDRHQGLARAAG